MDKNEKKIENAVQPFGIQMLEAQKPSRIKTGVRGGIHAVSQDIRAGIDGGHHHLT
jgi:hypothetical protein